MSKKPEQGNFWLIKVLFKRQRIVYQVLVNLDLGFWNKLTSVATLVAVIIGIALVGVWYKPLLDQNQRLRKQINQLNAQIKQEEATGKTLSSKIDALQHDPKTVERLAREKLGYAKPNETVIRFETPSPSATSP